MSDGQGRPTSLSLTSPFRYNGSAGDWTNVKRRTVVTIPLSGASLAPALPRKVGQPPEGDHFALVSHAHPTTKRQDERDKSLGTVSRRGGERPAADAGP